MANAAALINEGLWRKDREFQQLPRTAQCTFCQVLAQKDLDTAGVLTLNLELLAKGCDELTADHLMADFAVLEERRFLFVDYDTYELLVRSYVRNVSVKNRNAWMSVPKNSRLVSSEKIRRELAKELRRLNRKDATELADEIDPVPTPSKPPPDPVSTPSEPGTPSRPRLDGDSQVQVLVLESPSVGGYVGEEPSQFCPNHPHGTDGNCFACGQARRTYPDRKAQWDTDRRTANAKARQAAIDDCPICDEFGDITFDDSVRKCRHDTVARNG